MMIAETGGVGTSESAVTVDCKGPAERIGETIDWARGAIARVIVKMMAGIRKDELTFQAREIEITGRRGQAEFGLIESRSVRQSMHTLRSYHTCKPLAYSI